MVNEKRRVVLQGLTAATVTALGAGWWPAQTAAAASAWPQKAFDAEDVTTAVQELLGSTESAISDDIVLQAPDIAENGAVVPITVETSLPAVDSITIVAEKNPSPLAASFELGPDALGFVSTRIKMGETSKVTALVRSQGKLYRTEKEIKVTIGGCGG